MTLLDYLHTAQTPAPVAAETTPDAAVTTEVKAETVDDGEASAAPEVVAAAPTAEPVVEAVKQPSATHAETGTAHTDAEPATQIDGTPAATVEETPVAESGPVDESKPVEASKPAEVKKEEKKVAVKEKTEKTKAEGKGFFAKFFGNKDKSPKKEKKVKTPKAEKSEAAVFAPAEGTVATDAVPVAEEAVLTAEGSEVKASESKPEILAVAASEPVAVPVEETPVAVPAIAESSSKATIEPEAVKETETTPPPATEESVASAKAEEPAAAAPTEGGDEVKKEETPRAVKASRRISTRLISGIKNLGKRDHSPKEEKPKETATPETKVATETTSTTTVSDEAPKLEAPIAAEPLKIDEPKTTSSTAPPAAPTVAAAA